MTILAEEIKANLLGQPSWIINDIKTFQWIRCNKPEIIVKESLGGGNILSVLGLFSVLNYLGKVYKMLKSGKKPSRETNFDKKLYFSEDQAFKRLIMDCPLKIVDIQTSENLTKIWNIFRNTLSHKAQIPNDNQALVIILDSKNIPSNLVKKFIEQSPEKSFKSTSENGFICFVDKLLMDVENIRDWIIKDMDTKYNENNLKLVNEWIKKNE